MQNKSETSNENVNTLIEELKTSIEGTDKVAKQIQSLSSKLTYLMNEVNSFTKLYSSMQSHVTKSRSLLEQIEKSQKPQKPVLSWKDFVSQHSMTEFLSHNGRWISANRDHGTFFRAIRHKAENIDELYHAIYRKETTCLL
jgi:dynactin complex subunit